MPTTPKLQLPYPAASDPVAQGAAAIQALAEKIETVLGTPILVADSGELAAPAATFDFASIPAGYTHLLLELLVSVTGTPGSPAAYVSANGDLAAGNYPFGTFTAGLGLAITATTSVPLPGSSDTKKAALTVWVPNYRRAGPKTIRSLYLDQTLALTGRGGVWTGGAGAAINRLTIATNLTSFAAASHAWLYGIL
jgi:hypothetical protein